MRGLFIVFEGIDGCGKSTQVATLVSWLTAEGFDPLLVREPGGTPVGERVRELLLDPQTGDISSEAEALLYAASRAELVRSVIVPQRDAGRIVIADRFVQSSLAYQGAGRGLGIDQVRAVNRLALGELEPDLVLLFALDPQTARQRRAGESDDRIEQSGDEFFDRVASAYDELARDPSESVTVIDASASEDEVAQAVRAAIEPLLARVQHV